MRNLHSIALKCNRMIDKSIHYNAKCLTRNFTSQPKPRKRRTKENNPTLREAGKVIKAALQTTFKKSQINPLYLMDEEAAKKVAASITAHRSSKLPHVMQMNPGLGLLTKELLEAGIRRIDMFEEIEYFWPGLIDLQQQYPERLELKQVDFTRVLDTSYKDWKNGTNELDTYFVDVVKKPWDSRAAFEIIGSVGNTNLIYRLVRSLLFQNSFRQWGRMILYLCVPPSVSLQLTCTNEHYDLYRPSVIMFQTLFRCEILEELPRLAFYPKFSKGQRKHSFCRQKLHEKDNVVIHLVKIEANQHLFDSQFTEMDLLTYYYFVSHHFKSRANRIIPALENWVPGCGPALIREGINIYTEFGELLPHQVLNLYVKFKSFPGYKKSSFVSCVSTFFSKMEEHIAFNESSENIDEIFETSVQEFENQKKQLTK